MHGNMPWTNGDSSKQIGAEQIKAIKNGFRHKLLLSKCMAD